jgi:pilus assembly protein Flp/PilA
MAMKTLTAFLSDRTGATAIEYGLIASLIAVALLTGLTLFSDALENIFDTLSKHVENR